MKHTEHTISKELKYTLRYVNRYYVAFKKTILGSCDAIGSYYPAYKRTAAGINQRYTSRDRAFESHTRHGCVFAFILCLGSGLSSGWSPVQGVLPTVHRIKKLKSGQGPTKDCRAIYRSMRENYYVNVLFHEKIITVLTSFVCRYKVTLVMIYQIISLHVPEYSIN
jgi:hypothetical protein